ncbi:MAG: sensor histidine kinase [Bryobacterales bacterium]|nr:sensor histidine kinase [Bryobacterales bacterium]
MPIESPTRPLVGGLAVTLVAVAGFSWYTLGQIGGLRGLQSEVVDRNRRDSLQLLRIQNDLNQLGLAMRDMAEGTEPYPLTAWKGQFDRIRRDLDDALRAEARVAPATRSPEQREHLEASLRQFWKTAAGVFALAGRGGEVEARRLIRGTLEPQQASLSTLVARLLVQNNEAEQRAASEIASIYAGVERNVYLFLALLMTTLAATGLLGIAANRRLFARVAGLSNQRRVLARRLIHMQEETLHSVSRELHDELGQILTGVGALIARVQKKGSIEDPALQDQLLEIRDAVQAGIDSLRGLSQALHPSMLEDHGLDKTLEWYLGQVQRQTGLAIRYERSGSDPGVAGLVAAHVYRVAQEALTNVVRHSGAREAWVRLRFERRRLRLEVEDHGAGIAGDAGKGLGLVAMRERADILGGRLEVSRPLEGGTTVALEVPIGGLEANETNPSLTGG